jgi:hypothetical protein
LRQPLNLFNEIFRFALHSTKKLWKNGYGVGNVDEDGEHHVQILQWKNNRLYFNGNAYTD